MIYVELRKNSPHAPIRLSTASGLAGCYTASQARQLLEDLEIALDLLENGGYVQVEYLPAGGTNHKYTYRDPSGELEVGDLVEVDALGRPTLAKVAALGRGYFKGEVKDVIARLERTTL